MKTCQIHSSSLEGLDLNCCLQEEAEASKLHSQIRVIGYWDIYLEYHRVQKSTIRPDQNQTPCAQTSQSQNSEGFQEPSVTLAGRNGTHDPSNFVLQISQTSGLESLLLKAL